MFPRPLSPLLCVTHSFLPSSAAGSLASHPLGHAVTPAQGRLTQRGSSRRVPSEGYCKSWLRAQKDAKGTAFEYFTLAPSLSIPLLLPLSMIFTASLESVIEGSARPALPVDELAGNGYDTTRQMNPMYTPRNLDNYSTSHAMRSTNNHTIMSF